MQAGLAFFAAKQPSRLSIVDADGRQYSRLELRGIVNQTANALAHLGLAAGEAVAVVSHNCARYVAACFAAIDAGLSVVPINWHLAPPELLHILRDSQARVVLADGRVSALVDRALAQDPSLRIVRIGWGDAAGWQDFDAWVADESTEWSGVGPRGRVLQYTSATTGRPKGIVVEPASRAALEQRIQLHMSLGVELDDGTVHLAAAPLYHTAPLDIAMTALQMGHTVVIQDRWQPEECLRWIQMHHVGTSFMVPMMFSRLLQLSPEVRARYNVSSLKWINHGGTACPRDVKSRMIEWWGPVFWEGYGCTEAGGGTMCSSEEWLRYPGTVGKPLVGWACKILDENGRELPAGEPGLIYLRRPSGTRFEYKGDPAKTAACYRGDFLTVGDVGYLNEAGYLFICDRKVDMINCAGVKVYSAEVELALREHAKVVDCAVIGVPDALLGEAIKAIVQPTADAEPGPGLSRELLEFLGTRLAPLKLPRRFEYVSVLPRDPSGKLFKRNLRIESAPASAP
jgi:long-chain acyl-CoA synthetase